MFETVEKCGQDDLMKIGVGSAEHKEVLLKVFGCESFYLAEMVDEWLASDISIFRADAEDWVVMVNPRLIAPITTRRILDADVPIQVVGHEPMLPRTQEGRQKLRALRAKLPDGEKDPTAPGRPIEIIASDAAVEAAIEWWRAGEYVKGRWKSTYTPTAIVQKLKSEFGVEAEKHWARDQAYKRFGSYKRDPNKDK